MGRFELLAVLACMGLGLAAVLGTDDEEQSSGQYLASGDSVDLDLEELPASSVDADSVTKGNAETEIHPWFYVAVTVGLIMGLASMTLMIYFIHGKLADIRVSSRRQGLTRSTSSADPMIAERKSRDILEDV